MTIVASIVAGVLTLFAALIVAGSIYQQRAARRERLRYTSDGRWIEIESGCKLYLLEKGSGSPTVVFESGISATHLNWHHVQQSVSQFTRTASYDRAGLGWSSPSLTARTPANIAVELHTMLANAGIEPPYILVGHSFGGLVMRRYALLYPEDVLGMVLVDPMRVEEWPPLDPAQQASLDRGKRLASYAIPMAHCGLARLAVTSLLCRPGRIADLLAGRAGHRGVYALGRIKDEVSKMPQTVWPIVAGHWSRPEFYAGMKRHVESVPDTVREMAHAEPLRSIPIRLLTPSKASPLSEIQLSRIGDNVQQIVVPESAHWIHLDNPDLVVDFILRMMPAGAPSANTVIVTVTV